MAAVLTCWSPASVMLHGNYLILVVAKTDRSTLSCVPHFVLVASSSEAPKLGTPSIGCTITMLQ